MRRFRFRGEPVKSAIFVLAVCAAGAIFTHTVGASVEAEPSDPDRSTTAGACCLDQGTCEVYDHGACLQFNGTYLGDDTVCEPGACISTPTRELSWGKLKADYRAATAEATK